MKTYCQLKAEALEYAVMWLLILQKTQNIHKTSKKLTLATPKLQRASQIQKLPHNSLR